MKKLFNVEIVKSYEYVVAAESLEDARKVAEEFKDEAMRDCEPYVDDPVVMPALTFKGGFYVADGWEGDYNPYGDDDKTIAEYEAEHNAVKDKDKP